jgi:hypothetical protein
VPNQKYEMVAGLPHHPTKSKEFLYLTAQTEEIQGVRMKVTSVNSVHITKPMRTEELIEALEERMDPTMDRRTKEYRELKALLDTARHWMGEDIGPAAKPKPLEKTAVCSECGTEKTLDRFGRDDRKTNGRKSACLQCVSIRENKRYYLRRYNTDQWGKEAA